MFNRGTPDRAAVPGPPFHQLRDRGLLAEPLFIGAPEQAIDQVTTRDGRVLAPAGATFQPGMIGVPDAPRQGALARLRLGGLENVGGIAAAIVATQAVTSVLGFVYWTIVTHRFPVSSVGLAAASTSAMQLLGSLGMLGFGTLLIARLPTLEEDKRRILVRSALVVVTVAGGAIGLVVAGMIRVLPSRGLHGLSASWPDAGLFALGVALTGVGLVLDQAVLVSGSGRVQLERNVVASVGKIGFVVLLALDGQRGGMAVYLSWTLGTALSLPVVAWRTRGETRHRGRRRLLDFSTLRGTGRAAASHHVLNLTLLAPQMLFPTLVSLEASTTSTGYFGTVLLVAAFVWILPFAVTIGLFASSRGDAVSLKQRMPLTIGFGIVASLCADAVLIPLAPWVLHLFGGAYAAHGTLALRLIVLAGLSFVVKDHYVALRRTENRTGEAAKLIAITATVELAAAAVGVRLHGLLGLSAAWLAVVYVEAAVFGVILFRELRPASGPWLSKAPWLPVARTDTTRPVSPVRTSPAALVPGIRLGGKVEGTTAPRSGTSGVGPSFFIMCVGVAVEGLAAVTGNRHVTAWVVDALFWSGLVLIFVPGARIALLSTMSRAVRVGFAVALGLLMQVGRFALWPQFAYHDELAHENTLRLIEVSHRLFATNPLLPVSSFYPGLELCTDALHNLLGLSNRLAAIVVLVDCRLVLTLAIFLAVERITGSTTYGSVATLCYVCNEQYLYFLSTYSYETLALPLAVFLIYLVVRRPPERPFAWKALVVPCAVVVAVVATHHLTGMLLALALCVWAAVEWKTRRGALAGLLGRLGAFAVVAAGGWTLIPGNPLVSYLTEISTTGYHSVVAFLTGKQGHALFEAGGYHTPTWEIVVSVGSELVLIVTLVLALRWAWRARSWRACSLAVVLVLMAIAFPLVPAGHLTEATSEDTDRAAAFLFLGVGFVVTAWLLGLPASLFRKHARRPRHLRLWRRIERPVFVVAFAFVFIGQMILGSGPQWAQAPGAFVPSGDSRSIDGPNIAAAQWEAKHLARNVPVIADRDSSLLAGAVGAVDPVSHLANDINGTGIILSPTWTAADLRVLRRLKLQYVVVDQRDDTGLPGEGVYIESGEYDQNRTSPVPDGALTKLTHVPGVMRIYDNGSLVIYDVRGLDGN